MTAAYDPATTRLLTFHDAVPGFLAGADTPRAYLERCIATIEARDPVVKAWAALRLDAARAEADAATARYAAGTPLSSIDGLPIGIKDTLQTRDLPTTQGIAGNDNSITHQDSACVQALEAAGAIVVGKTVTTELGGGWPSKTTNPFDAARTPGGSSAGSSAAIGAGMIPAALGTQVGGSIIRPASFCGNFALKPTQGALHRGERQGLSQSTVGVHAGSLTDLWRVAIEMGKRAGGDPGHPGLFGDDDLRPPLKPRRLIVMESEGWTVADQRTIAAFEQLLDRLRGHGVTILRRGDDPAIEAFESAIAGLSRVTGVTIVYENRWVLGNLMRLMPQKLSPMISRQYEGGKAISPGTYRQALLEREVARQHLAALAPLGDALISPAALGAAPLIDAPAPNLMPTGNPAFNSVTSALGGPALTMPLASIDSMPVGFQLIGQWHHDEKLAAMANWIMATVGPPTR